MLGVLQGMARLMGGDANRGQGMRTIHPFAQAEHLAGWVVVVTQFTADGLDQQAFHTGRAQHVLCRLGPCEPLKGRDL